MTPWTVAHQDPLSMGFSQTGIPEQVAISFSRDLPNSGIKPTSLVSPELAGRFFIRASLIAQLVKNMPAMQETPVGFPGSGRSTGEGIGYPLQYYGWENSINCIVHRAAKSWTRLSDSLFFIIVLPGKPIRHSK